MGGAADEAVEDANVGAGMTNGGADGMEPAGIGGTGRPGNEPVAFTGRPGPPARPATQSANGAGTAARDRADPGNGGIGLVSRPAGWPSRDKPGSRSSSRRQPARYSRAACSGSRRSLTSPMPSWPGAGRAEAEEIPGCPERGARCCGRYPDGRGAALAASGFAAARSDGAAFGGPAGLAETPESPVVAGPAVAGDDLYAGSADPWRIRCAAARSAPAGTPAAAPAAAPAGTRLPLRRDPGCRSGRDPGRRSGCRSGRRSRSAPRLPLPLGTPAAAPVGTPAAAPVGTPAAAPVGRSRRDPGCRSRRHPGSRPRRLAPVQQPANGPRRRNLRCPPPDWSPAEPGWPAPAGAGVGYVLSLPVREE